jgi:hypothetical protein
MLRGADDMVARIRNDGRWVAFTRGNNTIEEDKQWAGDGREASKIALNHG